MDDVLNVSGHRLGTAEIEDVLVGSTWIISLDIIFSGDGAARNHVTGRIDDVLSVRGHRLGTEETEDVLVVLKVEASLNV